MERTGFHGTKKEGFFRWNSSSLTIAQSHNHSLERIGTFLLLFSLYSTRLKDKLRTDRPRVGNRPPTAVLLVDVVDWAEKLRDTRAAPVDWHEAIAVWDVLPLPV